MGLGKRLSLPVVAAFISFRSLPTLCLCLALSAALSAQAVDQAPESTPAVETQVIESTPAVEEQAISTDEELKKYLILSGWTQHLRISGGEKVNSVLTGLGYRQEFWRDEDRIWSVNAGFYNDSRSCLSINAGVECMQRTDFVDFGLAGGVMHNPRFKRDFGTPVTPYLLPFLNKQVDGVGARVYYFPPIPGHEYTEQVIFQLHLEI